MRRSLLAVSLMMTASTAALAQTQPTAGTATQAGSMNTTDPRSSSVQPSAPVVADATSPQQAEPGSAIADIIVTARRRAESLQSAPITVTAFTGAQLQAKGITDISRLAQVTPGVNFDAFPRAAPRPFFRGIGSTNQGAGSDPSSVAFLDGVYLARSAELGIDFFDMERVEVLKGPQGTLFGKNVVGGAVNFVTVKPTQEASARAQLTFGEYAQTNGNLALNVPLADGIATRIVLGAISNGGFRHTPDGRPLDDENKLSARVQTMFGIGSGTTFLVAADIANQDLAQDSRYNVATLPFQTTKPRGYDDFNTPRIANPDRPGGTKSKTGGARAELNTDVLKFATLTVTGAWRTLDYSSSDDLDGASPAVNAATGVLAPDIQVIQREHADSYSGETRLTTNGTGPLSGVAGLYYDHDDIHRERETQTSPTPTTINNFIGNAKNDSYAAYGELQYKLPFGVNLIGGARYTDDKKVYDLTRLTGSRAAPTVNFTTVGTPGVTRQKLVTYRVGADYRLNDHIFAFGTVSTGFKGGAFQEQPSSAALARLATAPEKVTNYEVGLKTDFLDRHVRIDVSGFIAKYKNFQTIKLIPDATQGALGTRFTTDTGDATIKGIETEVVLAPAHFIDLTARYTYLHPFFDRFIQTSAILANGTPVQTNGAGNRLSRTPQHAATADLGLNSPKRDWGWLRAVVSLDYQSDVYDNNINDFTEYRRPRTLWDASLTYNINNRFSAQVWVHNLTDVEYRTFQVDTAGGLFVQYGAPRQIGATFNAAF